MAPPFSFDQPVDFLSQVIACDRLSVRINHPLLFDLDVALAEGVDGREYQRVFSYDTLLSDQLE